MEPKVQIVGGQDDRVDQLEAGDGERVVVHVGQGLDDGLEARESLELAGRGDCLQGPLVAVGRDEADAISFTASTMTAG